MTTTTRKQCITILLLSFFIHTHAQDRGQDHNSSRSNKTASKVQDHNSSKSNKSASKVRDHNSSRSNKTASKAQSDDWTFGVNSGASFGVRSNEGGLFRGNSMATKLFSRYHFGNVGLGFSSGIIPGTINNNALNRFIVERKFQQGQVTKSNPFNSYLLFGPSFRFGNRVMVNADIQGGMFINNPGAVSIGQPGAVRALYRFEGAGKNLFPGFSGNISLAYPVNNSTRFFINTDYLQSKSSIRLYDPQRGIDVATEQDRHVKLFTVGVGITKSFGSKRDAASGMATGKKHIGNVKYENISITEDEAMEEEIIVTTQRHAINTKGTAATNGRMMSNENCGPVTQTTTNPDGTMEELSFACPDDAAKYNERISMKTTVPKQTQGATFGEKVNAGLHAAGNALSQGASRGVISGTVSWGANNSPGIITNQDVVSSVGNLSGGGGGAAAASYAATGRMIPPSTSPQGIAATIYTREAGSGMATGKRSARDQASGQATGKRQYQPVFNEGGINTCTSCPATVKLIAHELAHTVQQAQGHVQSNPLYNNNGQQETNPMYNGKSNLRAGGNIDCDGIAGLNVYLVDANTGAVAATTKTGTCGDFFFANTPDGQYIVKLNGAITRKKEYGLHASSEIDMLGVVQQGNEQVQLLLNAGRTDNEMEQRAGISTSRSNLRTKALTVIEADLDGDGEIESTKVMMEFNDGSVRDVTAGTKISSANGVKKVTVRGWDTEKKQQRVASANTVKEYTINITDENGGVLFTSQYENGTKKEAQVMATVSRHPNVIQITVPVEDPGTAGESIIKTKTKSNQSNDRTASGNASDEEIWSPRSNIKMLKISGGDVDEDGVPEMLIGRAPGGAVISAMRQPGDPIPGLDVKLGKNPGGQLVQNTNSNTQGEFEFANLSAGDYSFIIEQTIIINDETVITLENNATMRKGWDGTVKGGSKINAEDNIDLSTNKSGVQDHNSSRSNKSGVIADNNTGDGTTGKSIVNTTKSNTKDFLVSLDELDQLLNADKTASAAAIRTTKENSRLLRSSVNQLENNLQNPGTIEREVNAVDTNFAVLLGSVNRLGQRYSTISNVLKTKHDTAKNSIGNIR